MYFQIWRAFRTLGDFHRIASTGSCARITFVNPEMFLPLYGLKFFPVTLSRIFGKEQLTVTQGLAWELLAIPLLNMNEATLSRWSKSNAASIAGEHSGDNGLPVGLRRWIAIHFQQSGAAIRSGIGSQ